MNFRADLHIHSTCSDGTMTPEDILLEAKKVSLQGISITDHDSYSCYTEEFFHLAKKLNILILPGVEISSVEKEEKVHILAYGFDLKSITFSKFLEEICLRRKERNIEILEKLFQRNIKISIEQLYGNSSSSVAIGRPHIAKILVDKGYVSSFKKAFDLYLKDHGSCYVTGRYFSPKEVLEQIHMAKGKAVLAHPHVIDKSNVIKNLLDLPFDGIEAYYAKMLPVREKKWIDIAKKKGCLITGGSDFHGKIKPHIPLGCSWATKEVFDQLL